ncbi:MAG: spore coat protein [Halanaerobiales bacterium]
MLTQKEVLEISESARSHQALIEKFNDFKNQCNDPQVKDLLQQHQQILQRHHQTLTNLLSSQNLTQQQNITQRPQTTMV